MAVTWRKFDKVGRRTDGAHHGGEGAEDQRDQIRRLESRLYAIHLLTEVAIGDQSEDGGLWWLAFLSSFARSEVVGVVESRG